MNSKQKDRVIGKYIIYTYIFFILRENIFLCYKKAALVYITYVKNKERMDNT